MGKSNFFPIDLSRIKGSGEFRCPECGAEISPDDQSEDAYTVLEPIIKDDRLEKIILQCNKCGAEIHLIGFDAVEKMV